MACKHKILYFSLLFSVNCNYIRGFSSFNCEQQITHSLFTLFKIAINVIEMSTIFAPATTTSVSPSAIVQVLLLILQKLSINNNSRWLFKQYQLFNSPNDYIYEEKSHRKCHNWCVDVQAICWHCKVDNNVHRLWNKPNKTP